jgi:uncharacterized protein (TIGR00730 family)
MAKKQPRPAAGKVEPNIVPNPTLSRKARSGEPTEDERLLERPKQARPQPIVPGQGDFRQGDPWRLLRIMGEFVHAFDELAEIGAAITIFGSARTPLSDSMYQAARELAFKLAKKGFAIISGGGPGIMQAANQGAFEADGVSVGLNIELPREQGLNPYINQPINFRYFFCRKTAFIKYSEGFVLFPGGYGTLDEMFEALTLIQTGKIKRFPVVLFGSAYWKGLLDWLKQVVHGEGKIGAEDLMLLHLTDSTQEACDYLTDCYMGQCWETPISGSGQDKG